MKTKTSPHPLDGKMADIQERAILYALLATKGNRTRAAKRLGIATRTIQMWLDSSPKLKRAFPKKLNQWNDDIVPAGVVERGGQTTFIRKKRR